jgi:hypothetical protein
MKEWDRLFTCFMLQNNLTPIILFSHCGNLMFVVKNKVICFDVIFTFWWNNIVVQNKLIPLTRKCSTNYCFCVFSTFYINWILCKFYHDLNNTDPRLQHFCSQLCCNILAVGWVTYIGWERYTRPAHSTMPYLNEHI